MSFSINHVCLLAANGGFGIAIVIGILFLIAVIFGVVRLKEKHRTEEFGRITQKLGLSFSPDGDDSLLDLLREFHLFSQGRRKRVRNLFRGEANNVDVTIFDYRYTIGGGNNSRTHHQSVILFRSSSLSLPKFSLRPEGLFHKIGGAFGYQDVDFDTHPHFSKTYLLRGDESGIRDLFDEDTLSFFESLQDISTEGSGDKLIFYRHKKRVDPKEVRAFMQDGFEIYAQFRGSDDA